MNFLYSYVESMSLSLCSVSTRAIVDSPTLSIVDLERERHISLPKNEERAGFWRAAGLK